MLRCTHDKVTLLISINQFTMIIIIEPSSNQFLIALQNVLQCFQCLKQFIVIKLRMNIDLQGETFFLYAEFVKDEQHNNGIEKTFGLF